MKNLPYEKLPYEKIGRIIRASAQMEAVLWSLFGQLLGVDQFRARIIASSISGPRGTMEPIKRLSNTYLPSQDAAKLKKLLKRVENLSIKRNWLAHAPMHIN